MFCKKMVNGSFLLIIAILSQLMIGCNKPDKQDNGNGMLLSSFYPVQITVLNLIKNIPEIQSSMLAQPGTGCLHNYQLTPVDMSRIEKTDCMVINGAGMEAFLDKIIKEKPDLTVIDASARCSLIFNDERAVDIDKHKTGHYHHDAVNPHVWLSPTQYIIQIQTIASGLCAWDTAHASLYRSNMDTYTASIRKLKEDIDSLLKNVVHRDIITFHSAFSYFASDYNLNVRAVIQQEAGQEPSAAELMELIKVIKMYNIKSIFVEPQYRSKTADVLSRETGVYIDTLDPVVTGELVPDAYIRTMRKNAHVLYAALNGAPNDRK